MGTITQTVANNLTTGLAAGKVLQVQESNFTTQVVSNSNTYVDVGFTTSITPSSSSNEIYLYWYMPDNRIETNNTNLSARIYRQINGGGYSSLTNITGGLGYSNDSNTNTVGSAGVIVDSSHNTTNQIDYKIYFNSGQNVNSTKVNVDGQSRTGIMAMEVQA